MLCLNGTGATPTIQVEKLDDIEPGRILVTLRDAAQLRIVQAAARDGSLQVLGVTVTL